MLKDFDHTLGQEIHALSVVITTDSFFYSILDPKGIVLAAKHYSAIAFEDVIPKDILDDQMLNMNFNKICVTLLGCKSQFLPYEDDLFAQNYPAFVHKEVKKEKVYAQDAYCYFGISPNQVDFLNQLLGKENYIIHHPSSIFSSFHLAEFSPLIHAHLEDNLIIIYSQNQGKFQFYNEYRTASPNDVLYFILAAYDYTGFDPYTIPLKLSGWLEKDSQLFVLLHGYFKDIDFIQIDSSSLVPAANNANLRAYFYFLNIANGLCGS
jgi:Protein of unknown function (DUF3822)